MLKSILLLIALVPNMAFANFQFSPSISTFKSDDEATTTQLELRLGYAFDFGLFVGGFYSLGSDKFLEHTNQYYLGPMVGYQYKGAYVLASYILTGEQDLSSGGVKYSGTTGYQGTIGYRMEIAKDVFLGPELTMRTVEFENREVQGIAAPGNRKDTHILPSFAFLFKF